MRRRTVVVDGIATAVLESGERDAHVAVVFVHGNPGALVEWMELVEATGRSRRAVALDLPGFGSTPAPPGFVASVAAFGDHLGATLDVLGVRAADLVLHDFGGPWGLQLLADRPAMVRSLLLMNCLGMPGYRWHRLARLWRTPGVGEAAMAATSRALVALSLAEGNPRRLPPRHVDRMHAQLVDERSAEVVLELYRSTPPDWGDRIAPRLAGLDRPVRVVWGDRDPYISPKQAERFREPFPQAAFTLLRDVGHWPMLTHPEVANPVILGWLAQQS